MADRMRRYAWPAYRTLLRRSSLPIIVGPWRGEVGFEILYWEPFVRALGIDPQRLYILTRGGAQVWYHAAKSVELYALRDPRDVRVENIRQRQQTGELKQRHVSAFDRAVIRDAARAAGLRRYHVLHPAWLFALLQSYWTNHRGTSAMEQPLTYTALPVPDLPAGVTLPPRFVAVRFYLRHTFPRSDATMVTATETIKKLAQQQPVVLLHPGIHADEHTDIPVKGIANVSTLTDLCPGITPQNNLAIQSAVLARAEGFVGTYGGFAQLALRYGKPSVSCYTEWSGTAIAHKHLADALSISMGVPALVLKLSEIPLLNAILPPVQFTASSGGKA